MVVTPLRNSKIGLGFGKSNSSKMRGGAGAFAARSRAVSKNQKPRLGVRRSFLGEAKQLGDRPASGVCRWKSKKGSKQQRRPGGVCSPRRRSRGNWIRNSPAQLCPRRPEKVQRPARISPGIFGKPGTGAGQQNGSQALRSSNNAC